MLKNKTYFYELHSKNDKKFYFGYIKASSDSEAIYRLSQENLEFLQRVDDGFVLVSKEVK